MLVKHIGYYSLHFHGDVMRKCGMTFEKIREKSDQNNQGVCDMAWYAIKASDR